jgi:hypothetical protein
MMDDSMRVRSLDCQRLVSRRTADFGQRWSPQRRDREALPGGMGKGGEDHRVAAALNPTAVFMLDGMLGVV